MTDHASPAAERSLWLNELDLLFAADDLARQAELAVRTAVRAQMQARRQGADPIDVLLQIRCQLRTDAAKAIIEQAISYVKWDQSLKTEMGRELDGLGLGF
jgi:hypothetical protein